MEVVTRLMKQTIKRRHPIENTLNKVMYIRFSLRALNT